MSWRVAESLDQLLEEVDAAFPGRDRRSDGAIGDADHRNHTSDHNPWVPDPRGLVDGVVTARDFDEHAADGSDAVGRAVLHATVGRRDRRVKYVIYEQKIWRSYKHHSGHPAPWTAQRYTGSNPHATHIHVSVVSDPARFDSTDPWGINQGDVMALRRGDENGHVAALQLRLKEWYGADVAVTGTFDQRTETALRSWEQSVGLPDDGVFSDMDLVLFVSQRSDERDRALRADIGGEGHSHEASVTLT